MPARIPQEEVLPEMLERRKILEHAGIVLAEARSLLACLDQTEGRPNARSGRLAGLQNQLVVVGVQKTKEMSGPTRWSS